MPVAGAVVVPLRKDLEEALMKKLDAFREVEIKDVGVKGIAVVLEADDVDRLKKVSEEISRMEEVVDFNIAYLNWEDINR
jgi:nitrate reductase NapAB chaperone NapD